MECMRKKFGKDTVLDGRFKTLAPLNHGSFGMVFMAKDLRTGSTVALKCLTKPGAVDEYTTCPPDISIDERSEELAIHSLIGPHANIVNLIHSFETSYHVYLVLDFCPNGDLYEAIRSGRGPLETEHVRDFMLQLVNAVDFMHKRGIFHRDIKPENIFLTQSGSMKLGDFGLATMDSWSTEFAVGSDRYMSPEQYDAAGGSGYSPAAADVWAIGICLLNVLFSRNPFAVPTQSDPLFADYVRDRQSLFDIFPNMSEDTYNILKHCLSLDPAKRSLSSVRDELYNVVTFTTDDESLDDFCMGIDVVSATLNREPLRTPSITSPPNETMASFPWAKALQATPQKERQLSVIHDTEDMFPEASSEWCVVDSEAASLSSALDSGIGMSYKSSNMSSYPNRMPTVSSLPTNISDAVACVYGKKDANFSKSWSDLCEEEEEEEEEVEEQRRSSFESGQDIERVSTAKPTDREFIRCGTPALDIKPASIGVSSPRVGLAERKDANSRSNSPEASRRRSLVSPLSAIRLTASSAPQKYSPPTKRTGSSIMDKWAALGSLRRADNAPATPPKKTSNAADKFSLSALTTARKAKTRERAGSGGWRKGVEAAKPFSNDLWNVSKDWRSTLQPSPPHVGASSVSLSDSCPRTLTCAQQLLKTTHRVDANATDDIGDLEWVGGWNDLHL